jgi:hypothetical protein
MINNVGSGTSAMSMMSNTQRPPQGKDAFTMSDTDADGVVSQTELETLAAGIEEVTGNIINVDDALATFDMDSDGGLSGEELLEMLASNGFTGPEMEGQGPPPPPPPSSENAMAAYGENSGDDLMSQLLDALGGAEDETETSMASSISITT